MKKYILYTMIATIVLGCTNKQQEQRHRDVFAAESIQTDTLYHIAAVDGDIIYYDSIRFVTLRFPERVIRWTDSDCFVIVGSDTFTIDEFRNKYYEPVESYTYAQTDTITNTHAPGFYKNRDTGAWALRQILITGYHP